MTRAHAILLTIGVLALALVSVRTWGNTTWMAKTRVLIERLEARRDGSMVSRFNEDELHGLPAPVQRYFRAALPEGAPIVAAAAIRHRGTFNMGQTRAQWRPFTSEQRVVTNKPGFVWDGRVSMLPGVPVHVHDAYVAGEGILNPSFLGLVDIADLRGKGEVAEGELMRYLAEAAWYPTALLPSQGVRWEAVDGSTARAHLADEEVAVSLVFRFNAEGLIESVRAGARGRTVGSEIMPTPWEGRWWNYQTRDGMHVPSEGEVAWVLEDGARPYWRGTVTEISYQFAERVAP